MLVVLQGHWKVQCFVRTEYGVLDRWKISSDLDVLFKDGSFEVLSHRCGINNKEVSSSSKSLYNTMFCEYWILRIR